MQIKPGDKNDPLVEVKQGAVVVQADYRLLMTVLGFNEAEGSFVYNAGGRAIWVNPTSTVPGPDIVEQIVKCAEAIGQRTKINEIRKALDLPFQPVAVLKGSEDVG